MVFFVFNAFSSTSSVIPSSSSLANKSFFTNLLGRDLNFIINPRYSVTEQCSIPIKPNTAAGTPNRIIRIILYLKGIGMKIKIKKKKAKNRTASTTFLVDLPEYVTKLSS